MKTAEEAWDDLPEDKQIKFSWVSYEAGYNAAMKAMREQEPVAWKDETTTVVFVPHGSAPWKLDLPNLLYRHPAPQRELSREEVQKLWNGIEFDNNCIGEITWADLERFAKLVREMK